MIGTTATIIVIILHVPITFAMETAGTLWSCRKRLTGASSVHHYYRGSERNNTLVPTSVHLLLLLLKSVEVDDDAALLLSCAVLGSTCTQVNLQRHRFCRSKDTVDLSLVLLRPYDARLDVPRRQRASQSRNVLDPPHR